MSGGFWLCEDWILLDVPKRAQEDRSEGGIILPGNVEFHSLVSGVVLSQGEGRILDNGDALPNPCSDGDTVWLDGEAIAEHSIELGGMRGYLARARKIVAVERA